MIELLDWIFASVWRFLGVVLLLLIIFEGFAIIVSSFRGRC